MKTARLTACSGLAAVGIALSAYLAHIHLAYLRTGLPSACNINDTLNCDAVNSSPWSELGGVPVSHLGLLFYSGVLLLSLLGRRDGGLATRVQGYLLAGALAGGLFSAYLASMAVFRVHALCLFCIGLYVVNALLIALLGPGGLTALRALGGEPVAGWRSDLRALGQPLAAGILAASLLAAGGSSFWLRAQLIDLRRLDATKSVAVPVAPPSGAPVSSSQTASSEPAKPEPLIDLVSKTAPTLGPAAAPVTIVEISDFECPFCQRASGTLKEVLAAYPGQVRVVFRHFPLDQACNPLVKRPVHENACAAARAAVCAAARGQFWPLAEKLFADNTDPDDRRAALRELGLDDAEQRACEQRPATAAVIAADIAAASQAGITAVPVFLINGRPLRGARPLADFRRIIDEELKAAH